MKKMLNRGRHSADRDLDSATGMYCNMLLGKGAGPGTIARPEQLERSQLDFTLKSLHAVDRYLDRLRVQHDGPGGADFINTVVAVACYLGEVIRRSAPDAECQWIRASAAVQNDHITGVNLFDFADIALAAKGLDRPLHLTGAVVRYVKSNGRQSSTYEYAVMAMERIVVASTAPPL